MGCSQCSGKDRQLDALQLKTACQGSSFNLTYASIYRKQNAQSNIDCIYYRQDCGVMEPNQDYVIRLQKYQ